MTAEIYKLPDPVDVEIVNKNEIGEKTVKELGNEPVDDQTALWAGGVINKLWELNKEKNDELKSLEARLVAQEKRNNLQQDSIDALQWRMWNTPLLAKNEQLQKMVFTPTERVKYMGAPQAPESAKQVNFEQGDIAYA